jgi:hypothetical protein
MGRGKACKASAGTVLLPADGARYFIPNQPVSCQCLPQKQALILPPNSFLLCILAYARRAEHNRKHVPARFSNDSCRGSTYRARRRSKRVLLLLLHSSEASLRSLGLQLALRASNSSGIVALGFSACTGSVRQPACTLGPWPATTRAGFSSSLAPTQLQHHPATAAASDASLPL